MQIDVQIVFKIFQILYKQTQGNAVAVTVLCFLCFSTDLIFLRVKNSVLFNPLFVLLSLLMPDLWFSRKASTE